MQAEHWFGKHLAPTNPFPFNLKIRSAKGIYLYDTAGKAYMDLISGVAVSNLGHGNIAIVNAVKQQAEKHLHVMVYGEFEQDLCSKMASKLCSLLPEKLNCVYPVNSGTEANEAALKLAKRVSGRSEVISFKKSYHGSTHGSLSISGNEVKKYAFRPLLPNVKFLDFNNIEQLSAISDKTACVFIEVIQGDAGVRIADLCFLLKLRQRCDEVGALLIFDEIQTGFGRTGKLFAFEHYQVIPDILTLGKALGGGIPIGALVSSRENLNQFAENPMLGHISTFAGNPIAAAASFAFLCELVKPNLIESVESKGLKFEKGLQHPIVTEIRRKGLMMAIEIGNFEKVQKIVSYCLEKGLIGFWFISCNTAFRLAPPLIISNEEIEKACQIIQAAFDFALKRE